MGYTRYMDAQVPAAYPLPVLHVRGAQLQLGSAFAAMHTRLKQLAHLLAGATVLAGAASSTLALVSTGHLGCRCRGPAMPEAGAQQQNQGFG
jgi:hypothetical protein